MKDRKSGAMRVAVVGDFQIGKSSLVNCLLGSERAWTGDGFRPETDAVAEYDFAPGIRLVDTPGFDDARRELTEASAGAIREADAVVFVKTEGTLRAHDIGILRGAHGKELAVLFNCTGTNGRPLAFPENAANADTCRKIEAGLEAEGFGPDLREIAGRRVWPVNILWAQFGLGQFLDDGQREEVEGVARGAFRPEGDEAARRAEMWRRSGVPEVRAWLRNLPLRRLRDALENPERLLERILVRFAGELQKRWNGVVNQKHDTSCLSFSPDPASEELADAPHRLRSSSLIPAKNAAQHVVFFPDDSNGA